MWVKMTVLCLYLLIHSNPVISFDFIFLFSLISFFLVLSGSKLSLLLVFTSSPPCLGFIHLHSQLLFLWVFLLSFRLDLLISCISDNHELCLFLLQYPYYFLVNILSSLHLLVNHPFNHFIMVIFSGLNLLYEVPLHCFPLLFHFFQPLWKSYNLLHLLFLVLFFELKLPYQILFLLPLKLTFFLFSESLNLLWSLVLLRESGSQLGPNRWVRTRKVPTSFCHFVQLILLLSKRMHGQIPAIILVNGLILYGDLLLLDSIMYDVRVGLAIFDVLPQYLVHLLYLIPALDLLVDTQIGHNDCRTPGHAWWAVNEYLQVLVVYHVVKVLRCEKDLLGILFSGTCEVNRKVLGYSNAVGVELLELLLPVDTVQILFFFGLKI